jgi:cyclohexa-1,5-dienecarbonyl-CoA hydratase
MSTGTSTIQLRTGDGIAYMKLDAPPLNILTCAMMDEVGDALEKVAADRSLRALVITANGKAFSAGADVGEHRPSEAPRLIESFGRMFRLFGELEIPVLMGVDGAALGAGFELVMMADILVATERAKFGQPEIRLAFFAPVGVARLPALVGPAKAMEITATGRTYTAAEMFDCGLVAKVVADGALEATIESYLDDLRQASAAVMRLNGRLVRRLEGRPFEEARREAERVFLDELMQLEDVEEGIAAFMEKRKPSWKHR